MDVPRHWRLKAQRYALIGEKCPDCKSKLFPPRDVCPSADRPLTRHSCSQAGPTLFLMPEVFAETYAALGQRMEDHLDLRRIDPTYRIRFDDGTQIALTHNLNDMQAQLEAIEPGSFGGLLRYLVEGESTSPRRTACGSSTARRSSRSKSMAAVRPAPCSKTALASARM